MVLPPDMTPLRVLIVEDDPMMQLGLEQSLMNYPQLEVVECVADGYLGVQAALKLKPDVIVMDIGLPRLDGIAATQKIKVALPNTHVVMLTSHTTETEIIAALSSGADAYCIKGATVERLVNAIAAAIEGAAYLDPQIARKVIENLKPPPPSDANQKALQENISHLSERELEVLQLIVEGCSNPEIGKKLYLSPNTVKTHVRGIMNKLAVDDRVQAAVVALRSGIF
ncbi:MAG: response regulator transcription factor [Calothrix sp. MO_192.B10]|nr:response regulator transcription factor [Calothrix sp. MO_192.B10]